MKVSVAPFRQARDGQVVFEGWQQRTAEGDFPLPSELGYWDYQTELSLSGRISLETQTILEWCGLALETELSCLVTCRSSKTGVELESLALDLDPSASSTELTITVPGTDLGGRLDIHTMLIAKKPFPSKLNGATEPGSILWRQRQQTLLQGVGSQFPTYAEDFSVRYPSIVDAGWFVHIDTSDLESSFMSSVRLVLNSEKPQIQKLLQGSKDPATQLLERVIDTDVTRQLTLHALTIPEVLEIEPDFEHTSVAHGLRNCLQRIWPDSDPKQLAYDFLKNPWKTEAKIQVSRKLL